MRYCLAETQTLDLAVVCSDEHISSVNINGINSTYETKIDRRWSRDDCNNDDNMTRGHHHMGKEGKLEC